MRGVALMMLPQNYRPTDKEPFMNPMQQEYFRQKLLHWKN
jgi:DnaK suppressor protein